MNTVILNNISFKLDTKALMKKLHIDSGSDDAEKLLVYVKEAQAIGRPKVLYKAQYIESKGDDFVVVDGIKFISRVLSVNLKDIYRIFPYAVTCGTELHQWSNSVTDIFERYWTDMICEMALDSGRKALSNDIEERFGIKHFSRMSPGSLKDWPINEQKKLFELLGTTKDTIGVELTESFLMVPVKSVSGILFPTEVNFESCQLCEREHCPKRRAPYDSSLFSKRYNM